jgi:hypothetical protein
MHRDLPTDKPDPQSKYEGTGAGVAVILRTEGQMRLRLGVCAEEE